MKKVLMGLMAVCLVVSLSASSVGACWVYQTVDEMKEAADLIIIGELTGETRVERTEGEYPHFTTFWMVEVHHTLKGTHVDYVEIATGGTKEPEPKQIILSTDYLLDSYGTLLMMFASSHTGANVPLSPRGIVSLEKHNNGVLMGEYNIVSEQHKDEHEDIFTCVSDLLGAEATVAIAKTASPSNSGGFPVATVAGSLIGVSVLLTAVVLFIRKG